jgi:hypothetical protein
MLSASKLALYKVPLLQLLHQIKQMEDSQAKEEPYREPKNVAMMGAVCFACARHVAVLACEEVVIRGRIRTRLARIGQKNEHTASIPTAHYEKSSRFRH